MVKSNQLFDLESFNARSWTKIRVVPSSDSFEIRIRGSMFGRLAASLFLLVWLTGWSVGCVFLAWGVITDFSWFALLFATPFFVGWFFGAAALAYSLFATETLVLTREHLEHGNRIFVKTPSTVVPYKEITKLKQSSSEGRGSHLMVHSQVTEPVRIGSRLSKEQADALEDVLSSAAPTQLESEPSLDKGSADSEDEEQLEVRKRRPKVCDWDQITGFGSDSVFENQGKLDLVGILTSFGVAAFWNGIVSVFVLQPFFADEMGGDKWGGWALVGTYVFLTPFILIGLVLLVVFVGNLLEPFRRTSYRFSDREIGRTVRYFGIPRSKSWTLLSKIEMRLKVDKFELDEDELEEFEDFDVEGVGDELSIEFLSNDQVVMTWEDLTKAEADWISTKIESEQDAYFVKPGSAVS